MPHVVSIYYPGISGGTFYQFPNRDIAVPFVAHMAAEVALSGYQFTIEDEDGAIVIQVTKE